VDNRRQLESDRRRALRRQGERDRYTRTLDEAQQLAVLRDRERIARDLHEGVIQALFGVCMMLQAAETVDADVDHTRARIGDALTEIDRVIVDVRNCIYQLRPTLLENASLVDALRRLAADVEQGYGVVSVVDCSADAAALLEPVAVDVLHMAREAISNVARHAHALACRVAVRVGSDAVHISVHDDGRGFDPATVRHGLGLANLRERAAGLNGAMHMESAPGSGTVVEIVLPLDALSPRIAGVRATATSSRATAQRAG
jgi:signal transduction histidine kinase